MAWGRRCDLGCESWPDDPKYKTCPACGEHAPRYRNLTPLTMEEAERFRMDALFEEFYETRCAARGIPADGPLPDDYVVAEVT